MDDGRKERRVAQGGAPFFMRTAKPPLSLPSGVQPNLALAD